MAQILIVEDHPLMCEALALRIAARPEWRVCGEARTVEEALRFIEQFPPDLVLVDIGLDKSNGMDLIREVKARFPVVKIVAISGYQDPLYAEQALRAGVDAYFSKLTPTDKLMDTIDAVLKGKRAVTSERPDKHAHSSVAKLSPRELQVFRLIGQGMPSGAIAKKLIISSHTLDTHRENIKRKNGLQNAAELTRDAVIWVHENQ